MNLISGAQVDIDEDNSGRVLIFATDKTSMDRAIQEVEACTAEEIEVGKTYRGIVRGVKEFGAFVEVLAWQGRLGPYFRTGRLPRQQNGRYLQIGYLKFGVYNLGTKKTKPSE